MTQKFVSKTKSVSKHLWLKNLCLKTFSIEICVWNHLWLKFLRLQTFMIHKFLREWLAIQKFVYENFYGSIISCCKHFWLKNLSITTFMTQKIVFENICDSYICLKHVWLKNFSIKPFFFSIQLCDLKFYIWTHFLLKSLTQMLICVAKICQ